MKTKVVKPSDILRKAASIINSDLSKSVFDRNGACNAIERADIALHASTDIYVGTWTRSWASQRAQKYFASLFKPEHVFITYWFGDNTDNTRDWSSFDGRKKAQDHRIMALLMTADMAESVNE